MLASLRMALIVTRREVRDQLRDWRIIFPIVMLTIFFPGLMNFTARSVKSTSGFVWSHPGDVMPGLPVYAGVSI